MDTDLLNDSILVIAVDEPRMPVLALHAITQLGKHTSQHHLLANVELMAHNLNQTRSCPVACLTHVNLRNIHQ
jgi:hypothetical protein